MTDLPRHIRLVHAWSPRKSKKVNSIFQTRKQYTWKNGPPVRKNKKKVDDEKTLDKKDNEEENKKQNYHKKYRCSYEGCYAVVSRLSQHMSTVHNIKKGDPLYDNLKEEYSKKYRTD